MARLLFEALPPKRGAAEHEWEAHLDRLEGLRSLGVDALNVPEVLGGAYETVEPRAFAAALQRRLGLPAILNRVTVHHELPDLRRWATEGAAGHGIRRLVLVGGDSSRTAYPGAGVEDSLRALDGCVRGLELGVITIPHRRRVALDEPERLVRKARAGATFAISQILLDAEVAVRLQADVHEAAAAQAVRPPELVWSLAPVARPRDLAFLRWLGVVAPPEAERALGTAAEPAARLAASRRLNLGLARRLLEAAEEQGVPLPGFCVEHVMLGNIEAAVALAGDVRDVQREFPACPAPTPAPPPPSRPALVA